ncbi:MAG: 5-bromo-4-chloroindolyl phosphate hydrolysis family protein, partial [Geminicoccaceae bacterium]|nr:5-bromo-4-chloroindolyl phosphate hydrolysis family protein [Geminicoccaceae bacterium]
VWAGEVELNGQCFQLAEGLVIEQAAASLRSRELQERIGRIAARARAVLAELERDPKDISRARRFLVTYLDGTRDVIAKYAEQQHEVAGTALGENFRRVLDTIDKVFGEQIEVLKRDDRLDLEVQLEVLETQLRREGVH